MKRCGFLGAAAAAAVAQTTAAKKDKPHSNEGILCCLMFVILPLTLLLMQFVAFWDCGWQAILFSSVQSEGFSRVMPYIGNVTINSSKCRCPTKCHGLYFQVSYFLFYFWFWSQAPWVFVLFFLFSCVSAFILVIVVVFNFPMSCQVSLLCDCLSCSNMFHLHLVASLVFKCLSSCLQLLSCLFDPSSRFPSFLCFWLSLCYPVGCLFQFCIFFFSFCL